MKGPGQVYHSNKMPTNPVAQMLDTLCEVGEKRIAAMDAAGIDMQVLSLTSPGTEQLSATEAISLAKEANDFIAAAIKRFPKRFTAFAALPMIDPIAAVAELDYRVNEQGFKGALINGHIMGRYLDDAFFSPVLERAELLGVPLYIHPTRSPQGVLDTWYKGLSPEMMDLISGGAWGWHIETALHIIRLMAGGVFDRYPKLQIIVGHLGESLSFMLLRQSLSKKMTSGKIGIERPFSAYLRENVHYTFSGFDMTPAFMNLFLEVGISRIMFSTDFPFSSMQKATQFLEHLPICPGDKEKIAWENAACLLKIEI
jgi:hypothetical protein